MPPMEVGAIQENGTDVQGLLWVKLDRVGRGYTSIHVRSPPIAAVNDRVPVPVTHLASEAATLGSPLPCARLHVGAISVCIAAHPPNLGREKDLLHFLCIGQVLIEQCSII